MGIRWIGPRAQSVLFAAGLAGMCAVALRAQTTDAATPLQFEVASLKHTLDRGGPGIIKRLPGDRGYYGTNMPLMNYLTVAYQVRPSQIAGPDWISTDNFDLDAKAERPSTVDELHVMLQNLLLERFHITLRHESKEQPAYALVVDKGGPKLAIHDAADKVMLPISPGFGKHDASNVTMAYFAFYLSNTLDRTVVDKTGLDGHYDFKAEWGFEGIPGFTFATPMVSGPPETLMPAEMQGASLPSGPTIFNALRQQLGLRLDPIKIPVERLVISHIETLTEN
jgi:uncharacterized protein (TIGR03435 family)